MFKGKTAVVTGASRGIGKVIAIMLAKNGANVVLNYRNSVTQVEEVLNEIKSNGGNAIAVLADISNYEQAKELFDKAKQEFGSVDILVNNAGITKDNLMMRMSEKDFDDVININLKGVFNCIKHASNIMIKQKSGKIVNMSSVVGIMGNVGQVNYAAAKAGIIGITKSAARELAARNINVNAVAPGFIDTDMTKVLSDKVKEASINSIPLKKFGSPEDVANAVLFLASSNADYITGQVLQVNGGMLM